MKFWDGSKSENREEKKWRQVYADFVKQFPHKVGIEIGCGSGGNVVSLCKNLPDLEKLYCIDPYEDYEDWDKQILAKSRNHEELKQKFLENIKPYMDKIEFLNMKSEVAHKMIKDNFVDFLFIDGNHLYEYVKKDIELYCPKVKKGGLISGDDYSDGFNDNGRQWFYGVKNAVDEKFGNTVKFLSQTSVWWKINGWWNNEYNIIVAGGGSGSTFLQSELNAHKRPDVSFNDKGKEPYLTLAHYPDDNHVKEFKKRTNGFFELDKGKTIEMNMFNYLNKINHEKQITMLSGKISRIGMFFRLYDVGNVIFFVRHPLYSMISLLTKRHPEKLIDMNIILNSKEAVDYYAKLWNDTVVDHLYARNKIVRYEYAKKDSRDLPENLKNVFNKIDSKKRSENILHKKYEDMLKSLTNSIYKEVYDKWEI